MGGEAGLVGQERSSSLHEALSLAHSIEKNKIKEKRGERRERREEEERRDERQERKGERRIN